MDKPETVMSEVPLMLDMPLMGFWSVATSCLMMVPRPCGLNVFFTKMGIFFTHTG